MACFDISARAEDDILEIWLHIAADNVDAATRLNSTFHDTFRTLADTPYMGRARDELPIPNLRSFPVKEYIIFYRVTERGVEVVRILHGKRDIEAIIKY